MVKAIVRDGKIVAQEPLPEDWDDGSEVNVLLEAYSPAKQLEADKWFEEMEAAASQIDSKDAEILDAAIREMRVEAKDQVRRQMGLAFNLERREVLRLLGELSDLYPEMRLGQLLNWFSGVARGPKPESIYDAEDDELIAFMRAHLVQRHVEEKTPGASK